MQDVPTLVCIICNQLQFCQTNFMLHPLSIVGEKGQYINTIIISINLYFNYKRGKTKHTYLSDDISHFPCSGKEACIMEFHMLLPSEHCLKWSLCWSGQPWSGTLTTLGAKQSQPMGTQWSRIPNNAFIYHCPSVETK